MSNAIRFTPGSKVVFVSGGYQGGAERVGVVLGITSDEHVALCMLDSEDPVAPSHIEHFTVSWLTSEIQAGRIQGSMKETKLVQPVNPCPDLVSARDRAAARMNLIG